MAYYYYPEVVPKKECKKFLNTCLQESKFCDGTIGTEAKLTKKRKNHVSFLEDKENMMRDMLWGFIRNANEQLFNYELSYFQPLQFSRYEYGEYYGWHQDSIIKGKERKETRKLSLSFNLTDHKNYEGGYLEFYNGGDRVFNRKLREKMKLVGSVIVFDSRDWHRVTPVTKGVRYSIVCWTVGPHFI